MTNKMKVGLITGGSSGIGYELTKQLLSAGWRVISLDRSAFLQDEPVIENAIKNGTLKNLLTDLADYSKLKKTLDQVNASEKYLDVIFNNAGSMAGSLRFSPQGREIDFEVNTVAHFIIANELKNLLLNGNLKTIVNTSSNTALEVKNFDLEQLEKPKAYTKLFGSYASSKLALSLWTKELSAIFAKEGIEIRSADPGPSKTPLSSSSGMPWFLLLLRPFVFSHPSKGASNLYQVATGKFRGQQGVFVMKGKDTPLKFSEKSSAVFKKLDEIYRREFLQTKVQIKEGK